MQYVFLSNKLVTQDKAKISVFDHGFLYGDAIYDTLRGYKNKVWNVDSHLKRFFEGAEFLKLKIPYSKDKIKKILEELLSKNGFTESRIRILISRGENSYKFSTCENPTFVITAIPLVPLAIKIGTLHTIKLARPMPELKSVSLVITNIARQLCEEKNIIDTLFLNEKDEITEGSISNIFIVKNGTVITPTKNNLNGTIQKIVIDLCKQEKIRILHHAITKKDVYEADEVFITSVLKLILPISSVDKAKIKSTPGPITLKLQSKLFKLFEDFKQKAKNAKFSAR